MMKTEELKLTQEWDKTFPKSDKVDHCKATFVNRYGITLAADLYVPKGADGKLSALGTNPGGAATEDFNGNGAATTFTLAADPLPLKVLGAKVGTTDATVSAYNAQTGVVTLSAAPAAGTKNVHITYEVAGANVPDCILCDDVTVGTDADVEVAVYKGGCFDPGKVTVKSGYTITAADKDKLRTYGIIFKAPMAQI